MSGRRAFSGGSDDRDRQRDRRATRYRQDPWNDVSIVLVGLMGCGKTSTGRYLARRLGLEFIDADTEIEWSARMPVADIFQKYGEASPSGISSAMSWRAC